MQLSISQPIRIGDTVVVENESGVIEEITLTYVVVKLWDLRRMLVPMTYFLEKPFQNWNKGSRDTLAIVSLHVSRDADIEAMRHELSCVLSNAAATGLWDGHLQDIKVTEAADRSLILRIMATSPDADSAWRLRNLLRDHLLGFLDQHAGWLRVAPTTH
jgi:small-conductance mechanosensitive channel